MPEGLESRGGSDPASSELEAEGWVREHIGWMLALAVRLTNDRALAEDVVPEDLVKAVLDARDS